MELITFSSKLYWVNSRIPGTVAPVALVIPNGSGGTSGPGNIRGHTGGGLGVQCKSSNIN